MKYQKDKTDLHKRLACVLPEYPLISTFNGQAGTYKAVDLEGKVFLVTWSYDDFGNPYRSERLAMGFEKLMAESESGGAGWHRPNEGWNIE